MALGVAALSGTFRSDTSTAIDHDISGVAVLDELSFGGTPSPGVVIGGGIFGSTTPSPTDKANGVEVKMGSVGAGVVAPFIDVYPNPQQGFHLQGAIGLAILSAAKGDNTQACISTGLGLACGTTQDPPDDFAGTGLGIVVGVGYEGWVGEQWSIGVLGRLSYVSGKVSAVNDTSYSDVKVSALIPGALMTVTYH